MRWYQERAGSPTIGLIGANAFVDYRVGIDYAHSTLYLQRTPTKSAPDLDVVGLTLRPEPDEKYTVVGVADFNGKPSVPDVRSGDVLIGVDGAPATGATMGQVWSLLGGAPGQTRTLILERDGKRFSVDATVRRFLAQAQNSNPKTRSQTNR
jgi:C-terminal processing protease CtpA/Prc